MKNNASIAKKKSLLFLTFMRTQHTILRAIADIAAHLTFIKYIFLKPTPRKFTMAKKKKKKMLKREDGSKSQRGLWDNIRSKKKRGERPAKKGDPDRPTAKAFKKSQKK